MAYVLLNNDLIQKEELKAEQLYRAYAFGDGFFETMRLNANRIYHYSDHYNRISFALKTLKIDFDLIKIKSLEEKIIQLYHKNGFSKDGRARISFFRSGIGTYTPLENDLSIYVEIKELEETGYSLNDKGIKLGLFDEAIKYNQSWSKFKSINSQLYVMASLYAKENNFDDVLIKNEKGEWIESTNSNLFIVNKGALFTPAVDSGCVLGTMRSNIINICLENGIKVYEQSITENLLRKAEEVFLTNAINGVKWVGAFNTSRYFNKTSQQLITLLNQKGAALTLDL